jgi:stearoyl-CoA desaturase (delta-9 desaturase)
MGPAKDVHGPSTGFWNTLISWELTLEERQKVLQMKVYRDLLRDNFLMWYDRHYYKILIVVFLAIFLISQNAFWYVIVPASVFWKLEANLFVNWYCHKFGYKSYNLESDKATNSIWAGYLTMGEGWHNNHHAEPSNWQLGRKWWELDIPALLIRYYFIK